MKQNTDPLAWSVRLTADQNEVDYILRLSETTGVLSVEIPLFQLPTEVRKFSLQRLRPDTEAKIAARGQILIFEVLLTLAEQPVSVSEAVEKVALAIRPSWEKTVLQRIETAGVSLPTQAYFYRQLALDGSRKKPLQEIALALSRLVDQKGSSAKETSKSVGALLRDDPAIAVAIIAAFFAGWDYEQKRQLLARFERTSAPAARTFLLECLRQDRNETYAEGIIAGLKLYQDRAVLQALDNYAQETRSHSPRTLATIARWLADYPDETADVPLQRLLKRTNLQVAKAAGKGLRMRGYQREDILKLIQSQLSTKDVSARAAAWAILEDLDWSTPERQEELWQHLLVNLVQHPIAGVSGMAPAIFKHFKARELSDRLLEELQNSDPSIRTGMLYLLGRLNSRNPEHVNEELIHRLIPLLEDKAYDVRRVMGHLLSSLLRRPLSQRVSSELLNIFARSAGQQERLLTIIGCWVVLFQHNPFDARVETLLLIAIRTESRPVMLAAWRLLRSSSNPAVSQALAEFRRAGKLKK
ncbi:MAG: hypothetical protein AAF828_07220 [Bacteroidota bacterium]